MSTRMLDLILSDQRYFGDGPPQWIEGKGRPWQRPCKTARQANQLRCEAVGILRRSRSRVPEAEDLAEILASCSARHRCGDGACPECGRAVQRWEVREVHDLVGHRFRGEPFKMVTLAPDFGLIPLDTVDEKDVAATKRKLRYVLAKFGVSVAVGGVDFSVNVFKKGGKQYVQIHFTLFIPTSLWPSPDTKLGKAINRSRTVLKPIKAEPFDGDLAGLAYALKYEFFVRENYQQTPQSRTDRRGCANTRSRLLRGATFARLAMLLHRVGLDERLILIGMKRMSEYGKVFLRGAV